MPAEGVENALAFQEMRCLAKRLPVKKCLFCENPADSKEHVLPRWILRRVSSETEGNFPVRVARYQEREGHTDERELISSRFEARIVCVPCNTGWMSRLESDVARILMPLTGKPFPKLVSLHFDQLRDHRQILALWMTKTAVTIAHSLPKGKRMTPQLCQLARPIVEKRVPAGIWLDVAKARVSGFGAAISDVFEVQNGDELPTAKVASHLQFQFCLQINQLLLRVGLTPGAWVGYKSLNGEIPFRLFPDTGSEVPQNVEYKHLNFLIHSIRLRTWAGCEGEVPGAIFIPRNSQSPIS